MIASRQKWAHKGPVNQYIKSHNFPFTCVCWVLPIGWVEAQTMANFSQLKQYCWFLSFSHVTGPLVSSWPNFWKSCFSSASWEAACTMQCHHRPGLRVPCSVITVLGQIPLPFLVTLQHTLLLPGSSASLPSLAKCKMWAFTSQGYCDHYIGFIFAGYLEQQWV